MNALAIGGLGTTELLIIFGVIILLFGAAKLPELARSTGRSLRIFKAETKGLMDGDDDAKAGTTAEVRATQPLSGGSTTAEQVDVTPVTPVSPVAPVAPADAADPSRRSDPA